jgi:hypothetical protein
MRFFATFLTFVLTLGVAPAAHAVVVTPDPWTAPTPPTHADPASFSIVDTKGEPNELTFSTGYFGVGVGHLVSVQDDAAPVDLSACTILGGSCVNPAVDPATEDSLPRHLLDIDLGAGDDIVVDAEAAEQVRIDLGPGRDVARLDALSADRLEVSARDGEPDVIYVTPSTPERVAAGHEEPIVVDADPEDLVVYGTSTSWCNPDPDPAEDRCVMAAPDPSVIVDPDGDPLSPAPVADDDLPLTGVWTEGFDGTTDAFDVTLAAEAIEPASPPAAYLFRVTGTNWSADDDADARATFGVAVERRYTGWAMPVDADGRPVGLPAAESFTIDRTPEPAVPSPPAADPVAPAPAAATPPASTQPVGPTPAPRPPAPVRPLDLPGTVSVKRGTLALTLPATGRTMVQVTVRRGGKATTLASGAGRGRLQLRLTAAGRKLVRRAGGRGLQVTVRARDAAGRTTTASVRLKG